MPLGNALPLPEGFKYQRELITQDDEQSLLRRVEGLPFKEFESPACRFRFRRKAGAKWERVALTVEPRSEYLR